MLIDGNHLSFPDAKPLKYIPQHLVCRDLSDDI